MPEVISKKDSNKIINTLCCVHNGVFRMSPDIAGLVETSSSLARVLIEYNEFTTQSLQRSSVESTKDEIAMTIRCSFESMGCNVTQTGDYPGWEPNPNSDILTIMEQTCGSSLNRSLYNCSIIVSISEFGLGSHPG